MYKFFLIILAIILLTIAGTWEAIGEFMLLWGAGGVLIIFFTKTEDRHYDLSLYSILMFTYFVYALTCHIYRLQNGFDYIGSFDGYGYYLPCTLELIDSDSLYDLIHQITSRSRYQGGAGIFVYFVIIARMARNWLNLDLCLAIQLSLMPFAAMICVVVYHILRTMDFTQQSAYRWSLIFGLCSALFWLSSYIVRDLPINLAYAILIYLIFAKLSFGKKLLFGSLCVALAMSLRLASGFGAVPFLLLALYEKIPNRAIKVFGVIAVISIISSYRIERVFEDELITINRAYTRLESLDQGGNSTLASFNRLPWGISHAAKLIYAQFHPFPAWIHMSTADAYSRSYYAYNLMRFPDLWVVFFRIWGLCILFFGLVSAQTRALLFKNKMLLYSFVYSLLLLLLQASTITERRKMSIYPVLILLIALFWQNSSITTRRQALIYAIAAFGGLQLLALGKIIFSALS